MMPSQGIPVPLKIEQNIPFNCTKPLGALGSVHLNAYERGDY